LTQNLIPVVGGTTFTSNYEVCGMYSYDANGNFIRRESTYATTHTVSSNAAFVRIEVNVTKGISFEQYQNGLTLTYTLPAGTSFPVGGNQTLVAKWDTAKYTVIWKNWDGTVLETDRDLLYGSVPVYNGETPVRAGTEQTEYTFTGWSPAVGAITGAILGAKLGEAALPEFYLESLECTEALKTLADDMACGTTTLSLFDDSWDHKYVQGLPPETDFPG
jgi:hypothetical protein